MLLLRRILPMIMLLAIALPALANPKANYLLHCSGCHLPDGTGNPPDVPSLHDDLGRIVGIPEGRAYIIRVPGASQSPLSDKQLAAVLNWMLTEFNSKTLPTGFNPLSENEVAEARSRVLADPLKYRATLWPDY